MCKRITFFLLLMMAPFYNVFGVTDYAINANRIAEGPRIDGVLESEWYASQVAENFVQVRPHEGDPASLPTQVYIMYDADALYIAVNCIDSCPDSVCGMIQRRDRAEDSDFIRIYLDTFHDMRNAYYFGLTASGVQFDGTITNEDWYDDTWDGIWESAVAKHDSGWVAELKIPTSTFRHGGYREDGWGFAVTRWVERRLEYTTWIPFQRNLGLLVSNFGELHGLHEIKSSTHVEILPHVVGRWDAPEDGSWGQVTDIHSMRSHQEWEGGLDLKIVPSNNWAIDLTALPDFAQVDVDEEVINLSDYPVYLSEKRPFFLEGKDLFDSSPIELLYTRRITDPEYGGRFTGRWGGIRSSVILAQNIDSDDLASNVAAGRILADIGERSTFGFTTTHIDGETMLYGDEDEGIPDVPVDRSASAFGIDTRMRWGQENTFTFAGAMVDRDDPTATWDEGFDPFHISTSMYLSGGALRGSGGFLYRGKDYNINDLGWSGYSNTLEQWIWIGYYINPETGPFESIGLNWNEWNDHMANGTFPATGGNINGYVATRGNWWYGGGVSLRNQQRRKYADLDEGETGEFRDNYGPFNVENYDRWDAWFWFDSDDRKPFAYEFYNEYGVYRDGNFYMMSHEFIFKPTGNFRIELESDWERYWDVYDINDGFTTDYQIHRLRLRWSPVLQLSLRGTIQYIQDEDEILTNLLMAWNWRPGSWVYLVFDEGRYTDPLAYDRPGDRTVRLKWTWFITAP